MTVWLMTDQILSSAQRPANGSETVVPTSNTAPCMFWEPASAWDAGSAISTKAASPSMKREVLRIVPPFRVLQSVLPPTIASRYLSLVVVRRKGEVADRRQVDFVVLSDRDREVVERARRPAARSGRRGDLADLGRRADVVEQVRSLHVSRVIGKRDDIRRAESNQRRWAGEPRAVKRQRE